MSDDSGPSVIDLFCGAGGLSEGLRQAGFVPKLGIDFDRNAAEIYKNLKSSKTRIGTMDLKIASITISNNAILVSRNLRDFEQVPNLVVKDWTR